MRIEKIHARQILDSRATPTIEVDLTLKGGYMGRASVPSGASTGVHEALELRDKNSEHYLGKSVQKAVENVKGTINDNLVGKEIDSQETLDCTLIEMDGTENKSALGANAILAVSLAFAKATAKMTGDPLFRYISSLYGSTPSLPRPMFNIMNGGAHANWATDIQEFMIIIENKPLYEQIESAAEVFLWLGKILDDKGLNTNIGNEGGYAPGFTSNKEAFDVISEAIEKAGFRLGEDIFFGMDVAASEFFDEKTGMYTLNTENRTLNREEWLAELDSWIKQYPFISIEDPFDEDDWAMWSQFTSKYGDHLQIVGDDLLVTNTERVERAISEQSCNALLVKVNQIGTLTEALKAMAIAESDGWNNIISHRSGETEDTTISHIAVGTGAGQIKTGAPSRGERTAKYNELLRIEETLV